MKTLLVTLTVLLAVSSLQAAPALEGYEPVVPVYRQRYGAGDGSRIISGEEAKIGQFPHQVALRGDMAAFCGGSLISKLWVLSAGHCIKPFKKWSVSLGSHYALSAVEPGRITVVSITGFAHEEYDTPRRSNDLGLVKLPEEVEFNARINAIKLPPKSLAEKDLTGTKVRVSGWGKTSDDSYALSPVLRFVDEKLVSNAECQKIFGDIITKKHYCVQGEGSKSACNGDSGGSLTITSDNDVTHIGIVNFGSSRGCSLGYPSGYCATAHYIDWIANKTGIVIPDE